ncbi:hypothetical protein C0991_010628 [Blastosporella zonata]|nr:hypothetical protein C0991_010628 [Blastosporella zonata]
MTRLENPEAGKTTLETPLSGLMEPSAMLRRVARSPGQTRDRTEDIRAVMKKYKGLDFIPLRVEDAFSRTWWDSVGGKRGAEDLGMDVANEGLYSFIRDLIHG